jgi:hypothetical protein
MIRICSGLDPNLISEDGGPCTCGEIFDDVERSVIFPHTKFVPKPTPEQVAALLAEFFEGNDPA